MASRSPGSGPPPGESVEGQGEGSVRADPDVLLDVPKVGVEQLSLEVEDLEARVSLRARLSELLQIEVGVDVSLSEVKLETKGVEAEARLTARLENVNDAIVRTLSSVDANPDLVKDLTEMADAARRGRGTGDHSAPEATEAARRKAEEIGLDLSSVRGTGSGGRIILRDVRRAQAGS